MNRRSFISALAGAAAFAMDPERLLWVPKLISIPKTTRVEINDDDVTVTAYYNKAFHNLLDVTSYETAPNFKEYMQGLTEYQYIPVSDHVLLRGGRDLLKSHDVEIPINKHSTVTHIEVRSAKTGLLYYTYIMGDNERKYAMPGDELKFHTPFIQRVPIDDGRSSWPLHIGGSGDVERHET